MKKSIRLSIITVLVLAAMAFSAYGVVLAAPGLHLNDLFQSLSTGQITGPSTETPDVEETEAPDATETPDVVETESPDVTETPEATETPDVENDDNQGDENDQGEDVVCTATPDPTTGVVACGSSGSSSSSSSSEQDNQNDDSGGDD